MASEVRARHIPAIHVPVVYAGRKTFPAWASAVSRLTWLAGRERVALVHSNDVPSFQPVGYAGTAARSARSVTHVRFPDSATGFRVVPEARLRPRAIRVRQPPLGRHCRSACTLRGRRARRCMTACTSRRRSMMRPARSFAGNWGCRSDRTLVVLAGQVSEVKGVWDYIDAAQLLAGRGAPVSFVVLGDDLRNHGQAPASRPSSWCATVASQTRAVSWASGPTHPADAGVRHRCRAFTRRTARQ